MRTILLFSTILLALFGGCSQKEKVSNDNISQEEEVDEKKRDYSEISHLKIVWSDIFSQSENEYFVYFYSLYCSHCNSIKNFMIEEALAGNKKIYFSQASAEHVINEQKANQTNVKMLEDLAIKGYPSIIKIVNKVVTKNVAGETAIKSLLNS